MKREILIDKYDIGVPNGYVAHTPEEAAEAMKKLGRVLKFIRKSFRS